MLFIYVVFQNGPKWSLVSFLEELNWIKFSPLERMKKEKSFIKKKKNNFSQKKVLFFGWKFCSDRSEVTSRSKWLGLVLLLSWRIHLAILCMSYTRLGNSKYTLGKKKKKKKVEVVKWRTLFLHCIRRLIVSPDVLNGLCFSLFASCGLHWGG